MQQELLGESYKKLLELIPMEFLEESVEKSLGELQKEILQGYFFLEKY